jgi:hypothetical protein
MSCWPGSTELVSFCRFRWPAVRLGAALHGVLRYTLTAMPFACYTCYCREASIAEVWVRVGMRITLFAGFDCVNCGLTLNRMMEERMAPST